MNIKLTTLRIIAVLGAGGLASCSLLFHETGPESEASLDASGGSSAPSASFTVLPIACGETRVVPSNVSAAIAEGAPAVALYRWTLRDPNGVEVLTALGAPDEVLKRGSRVLGGTFAEPEFNLTLYRGARLGVFTRSAGPEIPSLLQRMALAEGEYELEAVVGVPESRTIEARLRNGSAGGDNYSMALSYDCVAGQTCDQLQYVKYQFSTNSNLVGTATNGMVQFVFYGQGNFYLDGLRLRSVADGLDRVLNDSFEDLTEWSVGNEVTGALTSQPIPAELAAYGGYTLSLNAIDELNNEGPVVSATIEHVGCN